MVRTALLVGLNYKHDEKMTLKSSYNNVLLMEQYLIKEQGFDKEHIIIITDLGYDGTENINGSYFSIIKCIKDMINVSNNNDFLFFYFTGYSQKIDDDNDNNMLIPADFDKNTITNELLKILFEKTSSTTFSIFDTLNCKNNMNLKYNYFSTPHYLKNNLSEFSNNKLNTISISNSITNHDHEKVLQFTKGTVRWYGVFTYYLIKLFTDEDVDSFKMLLISLKENEFLNKCILSINKDSLLFAKPFNVYFSEESQKKNIDENESILKIKKINRENRILKKEIKNLNETIKRYKEALGINTTVNCGSFQHLLYSLH